MNGPEERLAPVVELASVPVWEAVERGVLLLQQCTDGRLHWPPSRTRLCCGRGPEAYVESSGLGRIWSISVVFRSTHEAPEVPYALVLVRLREGPLVFANLDRLSPTEPSVGDAVELTDPVPAGDRRLPMFRLVGGDSRCSVAAAQANHRR